MTIGEWLRTQRKARGWTQFELAFQTHISPRLIAGWERGENEPSFANLVKLAKAFGVVPPILQMQAKGRYPASPFHIPPDLQGGVAA